MEMRILADLLEQAEEYGNTVDEVPAHEEDLEDPGDGGVEGDEEDNLPDPERLFNAEVVERRCIGRKKKGRICWGGGADEEKQENKNRAKEVIGLNSQNNK